LLESGISMIIDLLLFFLALSSLEYLKIFSVLGKIYAVATACGVLLLTVFASRVFSCLFSRASQSIWAPRHLLTSVLLLRDLFSSSSMTTTSRGVVYHSLILLLPPLTYKVTRYQK